MLQAIHDALATSFMRHGFPVLDESAKSWLEENEGPHDFKAGRLVWICLDFF